MKLQNLSLEGKLKVMLRSIFFSSIALILYVFFYLVIPSSVSAAGCESPEVRVMYSPKELVVTYKQNDRGAQYEYIDNSYAIVIDIDSAKTYDKVRGKYVMLKLKNQNGTDYLPLSKSVFVDNKIIAFKVSSGSEPIEASLVSYFFDPGEKVGKIYMDDKYDGSFDTELCSDIKYKITERKKIETKIAAVNATGQLCDNFGPKSGVTTALGCIPTKISDLTKSLVGFLTMLGGVLALILMASSAIQMMVQGSDAKALQSAQQRFVGAATGLVFIVFSVFLLKVIGVDILQIPGFR